MTKNVNGLPLFIYDCFSNQKKVRFQYGIDDSDEFHIRKKLK